MLALELLPTLFFREMLIRVIIALNKTVIVPYELLLHPFNPVEVICQHALPTFGFDHMAIF